MKKLTKKINELWLRHKQWFNIFAIIFVVVFIFGIVYFIKIYNPKETQKIYAICPEDYPDTDEGFEAKTTAMEKWINDFFDNNQGASLSEMAKARYQFYMENNCSDTLERYFEAKEGKADPEEMKIIRDTIQEEIKNQAKKNLFQALKEDEEKNGKPE